MMFITTKFAYSTILSLTNRSKILACILNLIRIETRFPCNYCSRKKHTNFTQSQYLFEMVIKYVYYITKYLQLLHTARPWVSLNNQEYTSKLFGKIYVLIVNNIVLYELRHIPYLFPVFFFLCIKMRKELNLYHSHTPLLAHKFGMQHFAPLKGS